MFTRALLLSIFAVFTANTARASVFFDSVHVTGADFGSDGASDDRTSLAQSFAASTPYFSSVTLGLIANTPSDGGFVTVYLVPDTGTSGATGIAGDPQYIKSGSVFAGFENAAPIGSISDASLAATPTLVSLSIGPSTIAAVAAHTSDEEYWLALVLSAGSSAEWDYNSGVPPGVGTAGQAFFNNFDGGGADPVSFGAYDLIIATPEPVAVAVLGVGLAGLGYVRRRNPTQTQLTTQQPTQF